jgi:hypothetical protein
VELLDASGSPVELIETGEPLTIRVVYIAHANIDEIVCGFLIRNKHGIHVYGTNTELQQVPGERVRKGEITEVTFTLDCWLAADLFSVSVAVHSSAAVSFDWLDGCAFFRVMSPITVEGITNLHATALRKRIGYSEPNNESASRELSSV